MTHLAFTSKEEDSTRDAIESLVELVEYSPKLFKKYIDPFIKFLSQVAISKEADDSIRQLAVEFFVTIAEEAPGMIRKCKPFVELVMPALLSLMVDLEDDQDWHESDLVTSFFFFLFSF